MATYYFLMSDDFQAELSLDQESSAEAVNTALNALTAFIAAKFPPPPKISIAISDAARLPVADVSFEISISYRSGTLQ